MMRFVWVAPQVTSTSVKVRFAWQSNFATIDSMSH